MGGELQRRPHLVRWSIVSFEKKRGGGGGGCALEVRNLSLLNKAFLGSGVGDLLLRMIPFGNRWL